MITSISNSQIKQVTGLQNKARLRSQSGLFVVEGTKLVEELPESQKVKVFVSESYLLNPENEAFISNITPEVVSDVVFTHMSDTKTPQGILAVVKQQEYRLEDLFRGGPIMILESLQDPGNLGTILRTGEGAGIGGVLTNRGTVDVYNPKVVRATMGSIYRVPYCITDNLESSVKTLKHKGFQVFAAHLKAENDYYKEDYRKKTAFLIGNEGNGLTQDLAALADTYIRIPMEGKLESLNAAVAATILMYEVYRQNR